MYARITLFGNLNNKKLRRENICASLHTCAQDINTAANKIFQCYHRILPFNRLIKMVTKKIFCN